MRPALLRKPARAMPEDFLENHEEEILAPVARAHQAPAPNLERLAGSEARRALGNTRELLGAVKDLEQNL